jgi:hypothetical protein
MRKDAVRLLVAIALAVTAVLAVSSHLSGPAGWTPDALFYQARVYEIVDGDTQAQALHRAFDGPLAADLRQLDRERSGSPQWVAYNARFYERRLAVPYTAAAIEPLAGDRALLDVSIAGYVAVVLALFWLLLVLRLPLALATAVSAAAIFLPALTKHSTFPLTDSWGLALEIAAFATAVLALRRGPRWLIPWAALIALASITRDSMWVPILAAAWLAVTQRTRIAVLLTATGVAAALPAVIAIRVPMRELLAQMLNGAMPAPDMSWTTIAGKYPAAIVDMLQADGGFVRDGALYSALFLLGGLALLFLLARGSDAATLMKAGAIAGAAYVVAVPVFSAFRIELVLVPMAAYGLALGTRRLVSRVGVPAWGASTAAGDRKATVGALPTNRKSGPAPEAAFGDLLSERP